MTRTIGIGVMAMLMTGCAARHLPRPVVWPPGQRSDMTIDTFVGDITECDANAIMLGTNTQLEANHPIRRASGLSLEVYTAALRERGRPLAVGDAIATAAGKLHARWLIHVPMPIFEPNHARYKTDRPAQLLAAYEAGLRLADGLSIDTLVIDPLINNFPHACAADVAVEAMRFCQVTHIKAMHLVSLDRAFIDLVLERFLC
jgi:O-acetyl-ADP-ribose deacetylase